MSLHPRVPVYEGTACRVARLDRCRVWGICCLVLVGLFARPVISQEKPRKGSKPPAAKEKGPGHGKENEVELSGTVKQVTPQGLVVAAEDGVTYVIVPVAESQVVLQGQAAPSLLVKGQTIEVEIEVNKSGEVTNDVDRITFVELSSIDPAGMFPQSLPDSQPPDDEASASFLARGSALSIQQGVVSLRAGSRVLEFKFTRATELKVRVNHWRLAKPGDAVKGKVQRLPQPNTGLTRVVAMRINIDAVAPIEAPNARSRDNADQSPRRQSP